MLHVSLVTAEVYRWVDVEGNVHYGNKSTDKHSKEIEKVVIKDKYIIPVIEKLKPIPYSHEEANRSVSLTTILLELPNSDVQDVRIGRMTCGGRAIDIYWTKGIAKLSKEDIGNALINVIVGAGYQAENAVGSSSTGGSLELKAKLKNVKLNVCSNGKRRKISKNSTLVVVEWSLFDPAQNKELITLTTKGSHNELSGAFVEDGTAKSFQQAMSVSIGNLLAQKEFSELIKPGDVSLLKEKFEEALDVEYSFGDNSGKFKNVVNFLKNNSVIIKTSNGHGSGVLINKQGFVLTNAHVVGDEESFKVRIDGNDHQARLIRKERIRDVALVKIENYTGRYRGVQFSKRAPNIGDELFVIGTPLKLEFEHTITKGIISAQRNISGLPYFQTDAAVNRGNSGGPVFDASGELIALTVSGMFTHGGASLNINYLIPINDAVDTLDIKSQTSLSKIKEKLKGESLFENFEIVFLEVKYWLNKPLFRLF